ncbi:16S rRNA (uracil(1498)-N(3))-methyltransferase [Candidatus Izemoplasma sp. B36]|uniref:RsmE family RNA methyltransferase n=1 Tax=Candidatus Izemoplasma sp. B36 TaxID=3242468 RepID=UPI00355866D9
MQRYFIENKYFNDNLIKITNNDFHHMKHVMRYKLGDQVVVVNYDKEVFLTKIIEFNKKDCLLEIIDEIKLEDNHFDLTIAQSLIKKDHFELVLQKTTELGVSKIIPLHTKRSIIKIDDFAKKKQRYETIVKEASEQSERISLPIVSNMMSIKDIDYSIYDLVFVCYARNNETDKLSEYLINANKNTKVLFFIGPEGGFTKDELEYLDDKSQFISLGKTILRSETAAIYIASVYRYVMEN